MHATKKILLRWICLRCVAFVGIVNRCNSITWRLLYGIGIRWIVALNRPARRRLLVCRIIAWRLNGTFLLLMDRILLLFARSCLAIKHLLFDLS